MNKINFNDNQKKAVTFNDGPCLLLAGPGSGKTFVLINRIYYLIKEKNINPNNILVITFTRAAANEMEERFIKLLSDENIKISELPIFGTFHSIFFHILKENFGYNYDSLINDTDLKKLIFDILKKYKNIKFTNELINLIIVDIKKYKLSIEKGEKFKPTSLDRKTFLKIFNEFEEDLFDNRKLDFHNMITKCFELLNENSDILEYYNNKFKFILIDEFQDINNDQYAMVKLLAKYKNVFAVGDDDQSIYKFRGAKPGIMREFLKDFRNAKVLYLNENYRCSIKIVKASKILIDNNKDRFKKDLVSKRSEIGFLQIKAFNDSKEENVYIVNLINEYRRKNILLNEMAILYRTNLVPSTIIRELTNNNIKYKIKSDEDNLMNNDAINLMTYHLSKGLEFKVVFLIDSNDGIIPHRKSLLSNDIETERRLFYVGMTRAKDYLHIFFTAKKFGKDFKPSRFIYEIVGGQK